MSRRPERPRDGFPWNDPPLIGEAPMHASSQILWRDAPCAGGGRTAAVTNVGVALAGPAAVGDLCGGPLATERAVRALGRGFSPRPDDVARNASAMMMQTTTRRRNGGGGSTWDIQSDRECLTANRMVVVPQWLEDNGHDVHLRIRLGMVWRYREGGPAAIFRPRSELRPCWSYKVSASPYFRP